MLNQGVRSSEACCARNELYSTTKPRRRFFAAPLNGESAQRQ